jgi:hypothetical protein
MPGTFPCPTTALGLLLLTTALPQVDKIIYILLLFCAIPFTPFIQISRYGVYEDAILFAAGIYSLVLLLRYWKAENLPTQPIRRGMFCSKVVAKRWGHQPFYLNAYPQHDPLQRQHPP